MASRPLSWYTTGGGGGMESPRQGFVAEGFPSLHLDASDVSHVEVVAKSPSGKTSPMDVLDTDGVFSTNFMPTEIGEYS